jgi:CubicO group peptidase (beta-lactamase class C family)
VYFEAQGTRYKEENLPMQKDTIFSLMSMTKPIVSTALMMQWEEARFLLEDPIAKWLPAYADKQVMENGKLVKARPCHRASHSHAHLGIDALRKRRGDDGERAGH